MSPAEARLNEVPSGMTDAEWDQRVNLAACYRLVQRVTGKSWGTVRVLGLAWALSKFGACCCGANRRWIRRPPRKRTFTASVVATL